jgi:phosphomannomutase/phosphoglucomutase
MESIFRAYDIRGIFGTELTLEMCETIGKAVGTFVNSDELVVGYDTRGHSPKVFDAFVKGVTSTGVDVISVGMVPNPIAYFTAFKNKIPGAYITASHNPPEYNGIKLFREDGSSFVAELVRIKGIADSGEFKEGAGKMSEIDYAITDYNYFLQDKLHIEDGIKMVVECFHGSAGIVTPSLFKDFGIETIPINNQPKGDFGGLRPEPRLDNLDTLRKAVIENKADFGVAFDGDADRSVFVDDKGKVYMACVPGVMFIKDILKKQKGKIVATIDCGVGRYTEENGGQTVWVRIGHGFIEESLVKEKALFAFEQSSHFYFNKFYPFSDGLLSALKMAELLSKSDESFSEIASKIKLNPTEKFYLKCRDHEHKDSVMQKIRQMFPEGKDYIDGIKIFLNDTEWVLLRVSQTNPEINICIEAKNERRLKELVDAYTKIVEAQING